MNPTDDQIWSFLQRALQTGWPDNLLPAAAPIKDLQQSYFADGDWEFYDVFGGAVTDVGFMIVSLSGTLTWGATYRGGVIDAATESTAIFEFLTAALGAPNGSDLPLRGPTDFVVPESPYRYSYRSRGELGSFIAVERILRDDVRLLYERVLVGGRIGVTSYGPSCATFDTLFSPRRADT